MKTVGKISLLFGRLRQGMAFGLLVLACIAAPAALQAAGDSGIISGRVTNKATGDALANVVVTVLNENISVVTQRDGSYAISVPAGVHTLEFSYTGLDTTKVNLKVEAGESAVKDLAMSAEVYKMEKYVVKGVREGNAAAIQEQRFSTNPKVVAAADAWGMAAANPGELVQRLPSISVDTEGSEVRTIYVRGLDPNFISVQVDGNSIATSGGSGNATRKLQMEMMGMGNVETVEVIKAPTPDRDANAVGGYVNLVTRRGYDVRDRRIEITGGIMGRFRNSDEFPSKDQLFRNLDVVGFRYVDSLSVFGGKHNLGIAVNADSRRNATTQDEAGGNAVFSTAMNITKFGVDNAFPTGYGAGYYWYKQISQNMGLALDYKLNPNGSFLYFRSTYNHATFDQRYERWGIYSPTTNTLFTSNTTPQYIETVSTGVSGSYAYSMTGQMPKKSVNYNINTGTSLKLFNNTAQLDIDYNHSYALIWYPGSDQITSRDSTIGFNIDYRGQDKYWPVLTQTYGADWTKASSYTPYQEIRSSYYTPNCLSALKIDFKKNLGLRYPTYLKVGMKYSVDNRSQNPQSWTASSWTGTSAGITGIGNWTTSSTKIGMGHYGPVPFTGVPGTGRSDDIGASGYMAMTASDAYNAIVNSTANDASMKERIYATYLMGNSKIKKLTVIGGARIERTDTYATAWVNQLTSSNAYSSSLSIAENIARAKSRFTEQTNSKGRYTRVHPSLQATYEVLPGLLVRGSYTTSISRPAVASQLPITTVSDTAETVVQGNPELKPYTSRNLDLGIEKYFEPVGQFSVGFFHKKINNYIASTSLGEIGSGTDNGFGGLYEGYSLTKPMNIGTAYIEGWEFAYQQQFTFLPGFWKGFGVQANETILKSEGDFGNIYGVAKKGPLTGLSPHQYNLGLFYTRNGWDFRLMCNIRGRYPTNYSYTNWINTRYRARWTRVDFKAQYSFKQHYTVFLSIDNLTNSANWTYQICGRDTLSYFQGIGVATGITIKL